MNIEGQQLEIIVRLEGILPELKEAITKKLEEHLSDRIWGIEPDILLQNGLVLLDVNCETTSSRLRLYELSEEAKAAIRSNPDILRIDSIY